MLFINLYFRKFERWQFVNLSIIQSFVIVESFLDTPETERDMEVKFFKEEMLKVKIKKSDLKILGWIENDKKTSN